MAAVSARFPCAAIPEGPVSGNVVTLPSGLTAPLVWPPRVVLQDPYDYLVWAATYYRYHGSPPRIAANPNRPAPDVAYEFVLPPDTSLENPATLNCDDPNTPSGAYCGRNVDAEYAIAFLQGKPIPHDWDPSAVVDVINGGSPCLLLNFTRQGISTLYFTNTQMQRANNAADVGSLITIAAVAATLIIGGELLAPAAGGGGGVAAAVPASAAAPAAAGTVAAGGGITASEALAGASAAAGVAKAAAGSSSSSGSVVSDIGSAVSALTSGNLGAAAGAAGNIFSTLNGYVSSISSFTNNFISPFTNLLHSITGLVQNFSDNLVTPIENLINGTQKGIGELVTAFSTDLTSGLSGLAKFPSDLANALTSTDAVYQRSTQELGVEQSSIASKIFAPAIAGAGSVPLALVGGSIVGLAPEATEPISIFAPVPIDERIPEPAFLNALTGISNDLQVAKGIWGWPFRKLHDLLLFIPAVLEGFKPDLEFYHQMAARIKRPALLGIGDMLRAVYRGIMSYDDAQYEASRQGIADSRFKILYELVGWLPSVREALEMWARGAISHERLTKVLAQIGLSGIDAQAVEDIFLEPINPGQYVKATSRNVAGQAGFLRESYTTPAPSEFFDLYRPLFKSPGQVELDWVDHWRTPGIDWWLTAYYKGMRTLTELELAAAAENIPPEVIPDLAQVFGETIQLWMIPDMLGAGLFTDAEAAAYLHYIGLDDPSIPWIIKYGDSKKKAPAAAQAADLAKISAAVAGTMFADGIIDATLYQEILLEHGYSPEAAALTVALDKQKLALAARKTTATSIVDQVKLGTLTLDQAVTQLYSLGFTQNEVIIYQESMRTARAAKAKVFTEAELKSFWKHGLIDDATLVAGLEALGWSADNAALLLADYKLGG